MSIGGGISSIAGGIGDLFGSSADKQAAGSYRQAAALEETNAQIAKASLGIQEAAITRDIYKARGSQSSAIAGAGFANSGSALDLARDTARQGALASSITAAQGAIDIQGHQLQADVYTSEAQQAETAAKGAGISGILGIATGVLGLFGL